MSTVVKLFKRNLWAVFLAHQLLIFILAVLFLTAIRRLTGRTIHAGRDPVGLIDGLALVILSVGVIILTRALYHWVKGRDARPLGIAFSLRRFVDLLTGLLVGFCFVIAPYITALLRGRAIVQDHITSHFDRLTAARILFVAFFLLLLQGVMEEVANRAFPMRLWQHRSLLFRILVPSIFFALIHLADEDFGMARLGILLMAGVVQSLAYALTGNIWLTSGVHTGANLAAFSLSGLWHAGAVVALVGRPDYPNWVTVALLLLVLSIALVLSRKFKIGLPHLFAKAI